MTVIRVISATAEVVGIGVRASTAGAAAAGMAFPGVTARTGAAAGVAATASTAEAAAVATATGAERQAAKVLTPAGITGNSSSNSSHALAGHQGALQGPPLMQQA